MFDDFKDHMMKEIGKQMPFVHCRILGKDKNYIKDTQSLHSFGCFTAMDLFKHSKEEKQEMPAMFIIPYLRKGVAPWVCLCLPYPVVFLAVNTNTSIQAGLESSMG